MSTDGTHGAHGSRRAPLVVVGDTLLDVDLEGTAARLTPDAPVPVLDDLDERPRPGGAGLAALMAAADGHEVVLVTALGEDGAGRRIEELLGGVRVVRLPFRGPTPVKTRVRAGGQSLVRLDTGSAPGEFAALGAGLVAELAGLLDGAASVVVADYGRGTTGVPELRGLLTGLPPRRRSPGPDWSPPTRSRPSTSRAASPAPPGRRPTAPAGSPSPVGAPPRSSGTGRPRPSR